MGRRLGKSAIAGTIVIACLLVNAAFAQPRSKHNKERLDLPQILSRMNDAAKHLKTITANLDYTKVTVLVNDKSTESGRMFYRNPKSPEILIDFQQPDQKVVLFKKNKAEIYMPKINQVQEYDLSRHASLIQQFFLLGFGSDVKSLEKIYSIKYLGEDQLGGDTTALLELTPLTESVAAQLSKVQLWISEESWLPVQQKFLEAGGDYSIARYNSVKVNRFIPSATFQVHAPKDAKRLKM